MKAWLRLDALAPRSAKVNRLKTGAARWLWIVTLCEAKIQRPGGRFADRAHWATCTGSPVKEIKQLLDADLLHESPALCDECVHDHGALPNGTVVVHGWHEFQIDPSTERVRRFRDREQVKRSNSVTDDVPATRDATHLSRRTRTQTQTRTETPTRRLVYNPLIRGGDVVRVGDLLQNVREYDGSEKATGEGD